MYLKFDSATGMSLKSICTFRACTSCIFFYYKTVSTSGRHRKSVPKGVACENTRFSSLFTAGDVSATKGEANTSEGPDPKGLALRTF